MKEVKGMRRFVEERRPCFQLVGDRTSQIVFTQLGTFRRGSRSIRIWPEPEVPNLGMYRFGAN
jgi:hypothetical protein